MKFFNNFMWLCILHCVLAVEITIGSSNNNKNNNDNKREGRKLFGGYRITPRFCKPTRKVGEKPMVGPSICMFNHECTQRNGQVVGACMDGFLFGACCQLPAGTSGELLESDLVFNPINNNNLASSSTPKPDSPMTSSVDIMSNGMSQITQSLLGPNNILPTAQDNEMVQINSEQHFSTTGVTHPAGPDTVVINGGSNYISPSDFKVTTGKPTTSRTTPKYGSELPISISNAPSVYTPSPGGGLQRPAFRPKPFKPSDNDKYVLVPTISHSSTSSSKPNKTQEIDSIVNILHLLNGTTTTRRPTTSYDVFGGESTAKTTSRKPPSTSYVFSTTVKPRRTTALTSTTILKNKTTKKGSKPTKSSNNKKTTLPYGYSTTQRPSHSTFANSPAAFVTTKRPPSTSYVYSGTPTRRPPPTINTHIAGPGFSVTSNPGQYSSYPSAAPTVIVLGPVADEDSPTESSPIITNNDNNPSYTLIRPNVRPPVPPQRKPVNTVTINNHVTQNIYSTSERPLPTVLITPKPTMSLSSSSPAINNNNDAAVIEAADTSPQDQLSNFPPVRNPNLNMSNPVIGDEDITTPIFVEDDVLDDQMESFVNKIIQGLQEPFNSLKDVVYNRNKTSTSGNNNVGGSTTKKPVRKQGTTTRRPTSTTVKLTTRRPTTRRTTTTRRPATTTKKTKTTRRPATTSTTTESFIEEDNSTQTDYEQFRHECGIRPLLRSSRIVGGKGATFGEFPWQVLVRESTWLGLFTKNKCGGVLISNKYVMTAAHCQPGFLASLVAVFGEFDISGDLESRRPLSRNVKRVIVHRKYDAATFENDLALLELEAPVRFDAHIIPICLPNEGEDFTGRMATVTGWGRLKYGGGVPSVLQEVQVPIMENVVCQEMFRTAGHSKVILESFLCAGYANGQKDSCEGDSGGPLVLQRPDGRYQLAGTVSHGIKCAAPYLPGVYMRTTYYKPWIEAITGI